MSKTEIITMGCRLNSFESEIIRAHSDSVNLGNSIVINTCAVTAEAERQARQTIRKIRRKNPNSKIVVTGCAAQLNPAAFERMPEIDYVLGNNEKLRRESFERIKKLESKVLVDSIFEPKTLSIPQVNGFDGRTRASLQIQQGCDHRCTFCVIPFARGNNRSVPEDQLNQQVKSLVRSGFKEIVLTGVDICSYGVDFSGKPRLGKLVSGILKKNQTLSRLRLSSLDPASLDDEFFCVLRDEERLMPHLHFSLQSMDDMVLKRMKRRHNSQHVKDMVLKARKVRPDVVFGADIIAGFPTESPKMFFNSVRGVQDIQITYLHVFPYSSRPGTPAAKMPFVRNEIRRRRAAILREIGKKEKYRYFRSLLGAKQEVLIEKNNLGLTKHFAKVEIAQKPNKTFKSGELINVEVTSISENHLEGCPVGELKNG